MTEVVLIGTKTRFFILAAALCTGTPGEAELSSGEKLDVIVSDYFERSLEMHPIYATRVGDRRYNHALPELLNDASIKSTKVLYLETAKSLSAIDPETLDREQAITWRILHDELNLNLESLEFPDHLLPVSSSFTSLPIVLPTLVTEGGIQPFSNAEDYENFLSRMRAFSAWVDAAIKNMVKGIELGITPPRSAVEDLLPTLRYHATTRTRKSAFFEPIRRIPKSIPKTERKRIEADFIKSISRDLRPAYAKLLEFIESRYLPSCRSSIGMNGMPNGNQWYRHRVRIFTTTDLDPKTIFDIGATEAQRVITEMDALIFRSGYSAKPSRFSQRMTSDPGQLITSRRALLSHFREIGRTVESKMSHLFFTSAIAELEIRSIGTSHVRSNTVAHYQSAPPNSDSPGIFYVNTSRLPQPVSGMEALYAHEAVPGHHYQISIAHQLTGLPQYRRFLYHGAYIEGWALYAESLGGELGLYTDPFQEFGRLRMELLRCARLMADVAIHDFGWDREKIITLLKNRTLGVGIGEIDRLIAWPAQALSYKIGQLRILELRKKCETELGDDFDIRAFHHEVLRHGAIPLDVLEQEISTWLNTAPKEGAVPEGM